MKIKEIIKYQWKSKENKTLQQKALKILGYFLVLMFILTILSRFADSLLIPIVKTETSKGMTITHEVEANGSIIQNREEGIDVIENLKVSHVNVYPGSEIKEGDTLFEIDLTDLKSQIQQVENEISEKEKNLSRATEDYNLAVSRQDKIISDAVEADNEAENLENDLRISREKDIKYKMTSVGPHRDDFSFVVNGVDIRKYGSQGQQRTAALSLKLSEIELVKKVTGDNPVLLLDDVLSELDSNRQNYLLNNIGNIQTSITCTCLDEFINNRFSIDKIFKVTNGRIESEN